jgi:hypothetical protein
MTKEPDFATEKDLEDAIASAAKDLLGASGFQTVVLRGFGLDIAVFASRNGISHVAFLEIKAFAEHHGRCGFGDQRGKGNQIRLLFDEVLQTPRPSSALNLFDSSVRWVLGNRSKPVGSARFAFFTCAEAQAAAIGRVRPGKQNNLRLSAFKDYWLT